jgi:hypothetical protein
MQKRNNLLFYVSPINASITSNIKMIIQILIEHWIIVITSPVLVQQKDMLAIGTALQFSPISVSVAKQNQSSFTKMGSHLGPAFP